MNIYEYLKSWIFGRKQESEAGSHGPGLSIVIRKDREPVVSDELNPPTGGIQGLTWFLKAFHTDEWGNIGHEILEVFQGGLQLGQSTKVEMSQLAIDDAGAGGQPAIRVRLKAPPAA